MTNKCGVRSAECGTTTNSDIGLVFSRGARSARLPPLARGGRGGRVNGLFAPPAQPNVESRRAGIDARMPTCEATNGITPKGLRSHSPGLPGLPGYPGSGAEMDINPERVALVGKPIHPTERNPFRVRASFSIPTQGCPTGHRREERWSGQPWAVLRNAFSVRLRETHRQIRNPKSQIRNSSHSAIRNPHSAFTLVELLVVISILVTLASLAVALFKSNAGSDRMRSGARIGQSVFEGAKSRATHAKEARGVRLIRDLTDPTLVTGFAYLAPVASQTAGNLPGQPPQNSVAVTRPGLPSNPDATGLVISGAQGQAWYSQDQNGLWASSVMPVRIPAQTGQWYYLARQSTSAPCWGTLDSQGNLNLTLEVPYQAGKSWPPNVNAVDPTDSNASCEIELGHDLLPFHQPVSLPSAVVIDLDESSPNVTSLWPAAPVPATIDIMFSPGGVVTGPLAGLGPVHLLLNDLSDASRNLNPIDPQNRGDKLILTIFPQTGLVATFPIDPTDANHDGLADDLFHFAKIGSAAGQ